LTVLVYSDDATIRRRVIGVLGKRPSRELPPLEYVEVATEPVVHRIIGAGGVDLAILDGEAWPAGGMGICRQLKDEIEEPPPVLILIGRRDDAWLANWSLAETVVAHPIDPPTLVDAVVGLLRDRHARLPAG
jgi:DNA-binding response OmpR family regulator